MRALRTTLIAGSLAAATVAGGAAAPTAEAAAHGCKRVHAGGHTYQVVRKAVSCRYARKWTRIMLRSDRRPRGWEGCWESGGNGSCNQRKRSNGVQYFYWRQRG